MRGSKAVAHGNTKFKQTDLGPIPADWEVKKLGECGTFIGGSVFPLSCQGEKSGDYPFFKVSDFSNAGNEHTLCHSNNYISKSIAGTLRCQIIPSQSIVFAKIGAAIALERKRIISQDSCIDNNMMAFCVNDNENVYYFVELLRQIKFADYSESTALPALNIKRLRDCAIVVPPLPEQRRIAAAISDVDDLIGALGKLIEKKRAIKTGAMQQLLTGQTRLPGFGGKWVEKRLGEIGTSVRGVSFKPEQSSLAPLPNTTMLLRANNIQVNRIVLEDIVYVLNECIADCQKLKDGDILICAANGSRNLVGKAAIWGRPSTATFGAFMAVFRCAESVDSAFVGYFFQSASYRKQLDDILTGSAINNLNTRDIEGLCVPLPPLPEQRAIAGVLTDMDAEISALEAEKRKYESLKSGMMQELLTGKVRLA